VAEIRETGAADARTRILDAALEFAWRGGHDALSVRALAERANVSSRTIYAHFPSLDALLITAIADASEDFYGSLGNAPFAGSSAVERVNRLTAYLVETMRASRFLTVALVRALVSGKPDVRPSFRSTRRPSTIRALMDTTGRAVLSSVDGR